MSCRLKPRHNTRRSNKYICLKRKEVTLFIDVRIQRERESIILLLRRFSEHLTYNISCHNKQYRIIELIRNSKESVTKYRIETKIRYTVRDKELLPWLQCKIYKALYIILQSNFLIFIFIILRSR